MGRRWAGLAVSGVLTQGLFRNPAGRSGSCRRVLGAGLGAVVVIVLGTSFRPHLRLRKRDGPIP